MELKFVREVFENDRYLQLTDVVIEETGEDFCRCSMIVSEKHLNLADKVQGGAIFTLADSAFAIACNVGHMEKSDGLFTVSQSASITYLRAVTGGTLYAEARKIGGGKKMSLFRIDVTDEQGNLVSTMNGNAYTVRQQR
ncbi:phenylacetic acid degradation protein [Clostridia bacterium]|nr:phenylacetic acid degradation protein [Clostridia bacterium]